MTDNEEINLRLFAAKMRRLIIEGVFRAGCGHPGGSLSCTEILTCLYASAMRIDPSNPNDPDRDRFVLSKGHCAPALYAALALRGYFPEEEMKSLRKCGSMLQGHPCRGITPGVDMSTGSLGQGISAAVGMAMAGKLDRKNYRVFAVLGDGEMQEGQVWEALMSAAHYKLDNLCAFLDYNHLQIDGNIADVMNLGDVKAKAESFGWQTVEVDGHSLADIAKAVDSFSAGVGVEERPFFVIAHTHKGQGVSFMTDVAGWHGVAPNAEQYAVAEGEIEAQIRILEEKLDV